MEARHAPWRTPPREVSSRFLAPSPTSSPRDHRHSSSFSVSSTNTSTSTLSRSLWPSSKKQPTTLADHLGKDQTSLFSNCNNSAPPPEPLFRQKNCSNYFSQSEMADHDKNEKIEKKTTRSASKGRSTSYTGNKIPPYRSSSPRHDVTPTPGRILSNLRHDVTLTPGRIIDNAVGRDYASSKSERSETANVSTARSVKSSALMRARSVGQATTMQWALSPGRHPLSPPAVNATAAVIVYLSKIAISIANGKLLITQSGRGIYKILEKSQNISLLSAEDYHMLPC